MPIPVALHWSSGKDAALALHRLRSDPRYEVVVLLTTVSEAHDRVVMHGVRRELLEAQAAAVGLPLRIISLPASPHHTAYEAAVGAAYGQLRAEGIFTIAFGDIFLEDLRAYREVGLASAGMTGLFPLWREDTRGLVAEMVHAGVRAVVVCADAGKLDKNFLGRTVDRPFVDDLPVGVDACGERGEFHTFVWDGPMFRTPVQFMFGNTVHRSYDNKPVQPGEGFYFLDLLPPAT